MIVLQRGEQTDTGIAEETFIGRCGDDLPHHSRQCLERCLSEKAKAMGRKEVGRMEIINSMFGPANAQLYQIKVWLR